MNKPYVTPDICGPCGGQCCLKVPGANWPQDFGLPRIKKQLREALDSGRYAIDWWEGDPRHDYHDDDEMGCAYFVRPAVKGMEGVLRDPTWGGPCTFLEEGVGCVLDPKQRPRACRWLDL